MSGSITRPDYGADIADLARRLGALERRTAPRVPESIMLPIRLLAEGSIMMDGQYCGLQTVELSKLDGSDPNIRWGDLLSLTISTGPFTLAAGRVVQPVLFIPPFSSGSLDFDVKFIVWNAAVTQRIRVHYPSISITSGPPGTSWGPVSGTSASTDMAIGAELSLDSNNRVANAGAGIFLANALFTFTATPTP